MDTATAHKRLEEIREELDRSIRVLRGEQEADVWASEYPQDPADAGANLSESERTEAILALAKVTAVPGARRPEAHRAWHVRDVRGLRWRGSRRPARGQAGSGQMRQVPGKMGQATPLSPMLE